MNTLPVVSLTASSFKFFHFPSFSHSPAFCFTKSLILTPSRLQQLSFQSSLNSLSPSQSQLSKEYEEEEEEEEDDDGDELGGLIGENPSPTIGIKFSKRILNLSILTLLTNGFLLDKAKSISDLQRYIDSKDGFTLLVPSSWIKLEKAGANVLFEEAEKRSNNIGVVVSPVRIKTLQDFGTPQFVADKLINAEKRKESTKEVEVVSVGERSGNGQQVYEFEYKIDSTRGGFKRVFSAAFVSSNKLYLLNVVHSDKPEDPLDSVTRLMLEQVLHSFDAFTIQ